MGTSRVHDGARHYRTTRVKCGGGAPYSPPILKNTGKEIPVDGWGGTNYGWFAETKDVPAWLRGRRFIMYDASVYVAK